MAILNFKVRLTRNVGRDMFIVSAIGPLESECFYEAPPVIFPAIGHRLSQLGVADQELSQLNKPDLAMKGAEWFGEVNLDENLLYDTGYVRKDFTKLLSAPGW